MLALAGIPASFAQISKGDPSASTIKTGNRPGAGDFGLFLGGGTSVSNMSEYYFLPILNFKYFSSDKLELRIGVDVYRQSTKYRGKQIEGSPSATPVSTFDSKTVRADGFFHVWPGLAYHFSNSNILDVYVGAELPFGFKNYKDAVTTSSTSSRVISWNPFNVGLNAFVGLQAFIGNLPLAIGLEYGIGSSLDLLTRYKVQETNGNQTVTYYQTTRNTTSRMYSSLSGVESFVDQTVRLTLSYYFN